MEIRFTRSCVLRNAWTEAITELFIRLASSIPDHHRHNNLHHLLRLRPSGRHNIDHHRPSRVSRKPLINPQNIFFRLFRSEKLSFPDRRACRDSDQHPVLGPTRHRHRSSGPSRPTTPASGRGSVLPLGTRCRSGAGCHPAEPAMAQQSDEPAGAAADTGI